MIVKITKQEEKAIKAHNKCYGIDDFVIVMKSNDDFHNEFSPLNNILPSEYAAVIYGDYKLYDEFQVGDWVIHALDPDVPRKIIEKDRIPGFYTLKDGLDASPDNLRKATKEEIMWGELGRKINEYKKGDVFKELGDPYFSKVEFAFDTYVLDDDITKVNKDDMKLVCPVEKRVDIE